MTIRAQLYDGTVLEFPDDTPDDVIERVAGSETETLRTAEARVPLPDGVTPSNAGGGRGSINPPRPEPGLVERATSAVKSLFTPSDPGLNTKNGDGSLFDKPRADVAPPPDMPDVSTPQGQRTAIDMSRSPIGQAQDAEKRRLENARLNAPEARAPDAQTARGLEIGETLRNPALRGVAAGALSLGQAGLGIARAGADIVGADGVADAIGAASAGGARVTGAITTGLQGTDKLISDVAQSIAANIPTLVVGVAGGPAMTALFTQSAASEYNTGRNSGFSPADSAARAGIFAAAEVLGERFGFPEQIKLIKGVTKDVPLPELARTVRDMLIKEVPGEQLTTAMQFIADKVGPAAQNPNATLDDYLGQAGETLKLTLAQSAVMGGVPAGLSTVRRATRRADAAIAGQPWAPTPPTGALTPPAPQPVAPTTPKVEDMPTTPISPEEIRQRAPAMPAGATEVGIAAVPQGSLAERAAKTLEVPNVGAEVQAPAVPQEGGQRPDPVQPGGVGDLRPAPANPDGRVLDPAGGTVASSPAPAPVAGEGAAGVALKEPAAPAQAPAPAPEVPRIDPRKFAPPDPNVVVSDPPAPRGKPTGFDPAQAEDAKIVEPAPAPVAEAPAPAPVSPETAPTEHVTPTPSVEGFGTRAAAAKFLKDNGLNEKFYPNPDGTVTPFVADKTAQVSDDAGAVANLATALGQMQRRPGGGTKAPIKLVPLREVGNRVAAKTAQAIHAAFGTKITFVHGLRANGSFGAMYKGRTFLDISNPDFIQTMGHEAAHALEKSDPDLYAKLKQTILDNQGEGADAYLAERGKSYSKEQLPDEFTADINGAMWRDPKFWERVHELDQGSTFRKLLYQFMRAATKLASVARAQRIDVSALLKDVDQVRETAAKVWAERAQRNGESKRVTEALSGQPQFDEKPTDLARPTDELYSNLAPTEAESYKPTIPAMRKEHAALRALLDCLRG